MEVYRVTKRVELGIKATAVCSEKLQQLLKDINRVWNNLMGFMSLAKLTVRMLWNKHTDVCLCVIGPSAQTGPLCWSPQLRAADNTMKPCWIHYCHFLMLKSMCHWSRLRILLLMQCLDQSGWCGQYRFIYSAACLCQHSGLVVFHSDTVAQRNPDAADM